MKPVENKLEEIKLKAIEEIESKTWGVTQQFLEIHQVVYADNKPKVERVDRVPGPDAFDSKPIQFFRPLER